MIGALECLDENTVADLIGCRLSDDAAARAEEHLDSCADCTALVAALAKGLAPRTAAAGDSIGRYRVLSVIGAGAMGIVYEAHDPKLDRRVAIKVLRARGDDEAHRDRLVREAQVLARLDHPNVVSVYDVGTEGNDVFIAMALVTGRTLADWLAEKKRSWHEIVAIFTSAGRGLAAAHHQGIVHRDFKPANVLVGTDDVARVADFGLARLAATARSEPEQLATSLVTTATGRLVGTPAYMSPEQLSASGVDARSDQFSFCVALYEALYGTRPFAGRDVAELRRNVEGGLGDEPRGRDVPAWLRRVLRRGLESDPDRRYPSMDELLADLTRDRRRVRVIAIGAALAVAVVGGSVAFALYGQSDAQRPCTGAQRELAGVWDAAKREQVRAALQATRVPYAGDAAKRVTGALDAYAAAWVGAHDRACEATLVRKEQSDDQYARRLLCLDERLRSLGAAANVLAAADRSVAARTVEIVGALPRIEDCADLRLLASRIKPPSDPAVRAQLRRHAVELVQIRALRAAGQYKAALPRAELLVTQAKAIAFRPLQADALHELASLQSELSLPGAAPKLREAALAYEAAGDDAGAVKAWIDLANTTGYEEGRASDAADWLQHAEAVLERIGGNAHLEAELFNSRAAIAAAAGRFDEAQTLFTRALERGEGHVDERRIADFGSNIATMLMRQNNYADAIPYLRRALAIDERVYGPRHPKVAGSLENLGAGISQTSPDEAEPLLVRARQIYEDVYGRDHLHVAGVNVNLGVLAFQRRRYQEALDLEAAALAIQERVLPADHFDVGITSGNVCHAYLSLERYREALAACRRSLDILGKAFGNDSPDLAEALAHTAAAQLGLGDARAALAPAERAVALLAKSGDPVELADYRFILARTLRALHTDPRRARALAVQARTAYAADAARYPHELAAIDAWLGSSN